MRFMASLALLVHVIAAAPAYAAVDLSKLDRLEGISVYSGDQESRVVIRFGSGRKEPLRPVFYEKSIQMDIEGAYVNPPQREFTLGDPFLPKAAAYQIGPATVRLRLFLNDDCRKYENLWSGSLNGELAILAIKKIQGEAAPVKPSRVEEPPAPESLDVKGLEDILKEAEMSLAAGAAGEEEKKIESAPAAPVEPKEPEKKSRPEPGERFKNIFAKGAASPESLKYEEPSSAEPPSLGGMAVKMIASLSLVLALIFALAWAGKKYSGKLGGAFGSGGLVKILASGPIDMKKRVVVVDVAGEVMVLGLAGESITMLGVIDDEEKADLIRRRSGHGAPVDEPGAAPGGSSKPSFLGRAAGALRIGRMKAPARSGALFDEGDTDTFTGAMAMAGRGDSANSRDELLRKVTGAIKAKNERLGYV